RSEVAVVDVARADADNLAVADVALVDPLPMVDSPAVVTTNIVNLGRTERRDVRVQLLLGRPSSGSEALQPVEEQRIDTLPPSGRLAVTFGLEGQVRFREKGIHVLQVRLSDRTDPDKPIDALAADDVRSIAVQVRDGLHAILVD